MQQNANSQKVKAHNQRPSHRVDAIIEDTDHKALFSLFHLTHFSTDFLHVLWSHSVIVKYSFPVTILQTIFPHSLSSPLPQSQPSIVTLKPFHFSIPSIPHRLSLFLNLLLSLLIPPSPPSPLLSRPRPRTLKPRDTSPSLLISSSWSDGLDSESNESLSW